MSMTRRKPRIALMGEFSAGKSTLSNLLLGARPLPEKVTATRLSPVWMSFGSQAPYRVDVDGTEEQIVISDLGHIPVEETRVIRLFFEADILNVCDLIDFPGISDPNMSSDVWQRMLEEVDAVLWCTHATQAWRQSEAAVWADMPEAVRERSVLLITRFDKLKTERDRQRVQKRLDKETAGLFAATFPISLTQALAAGEDYEAFEESGGIDFLQHFLEMIDDLAEIVADTDQSVYAANMVVEPQPEVAEEPAPVAAAPHVSENETTTPAEESPDARPLRLQPEPTAQVIEAPQPSAPVPEAAEVQQQQNDDAVEPQRVLPRRVMAKSTAERSVRPRSKSRAIDMTDARPEPEAPRRRTAVSELREIFHDDRSAAR